MTAACACRSATTASGGADPAAGGGLHGLRDRVDALDGRLELDSPPGGGTTRHGRDPTASEAAIESTGGRCAAASNQLAPASAEPNTAPDVAPK